MGARKRKARVTPQMVSDILRMLGARGGHARAKNMSKEERSEGSRLAAKARWAKSKKRST
jgi:hypothetical protein